MSLDEGLWEVVESLLAEARKGDVQAAKLLFARLCEPVDPRESIHILTTTLTDEEAARKAARLLSRAAARSRKAAEAQNGKPAQLAPRSKPRPETSAQVQEEPPEPTPELAPREIFGIPAEWIEAAQQRWRLPDTPPLVSAVGCCLTKDGFAIVARRSGLLLHELRRVLQGVDRVREACGGSVPFALDQGNGGSALAEKLRAKGLEVSGFHPTDRVKLELRLRDALDPDGSTRLGLPPGHFDENGLIAVALALSIDGPERHGQLPQSAARSQPRTRDPFDRM